MAKYELKTKRNKKSVTEFINSVTDPIRKKDAKVILKMMRKVTGKRPEMWGDSIIGFDTYHYKYSSGQEGDWMAIGFSPRKQAMSIYIMPGYKDYGPIMKKLGPYKKGKSCLYLKNLEDIHLPTLKKLIKEGYKDIKKLNK